MELRLANRSVNCVFANISTTRTYLFTDFCPIVLWLCPYDVPIRLLVYCGAYAMDWEVAVCLKNLIMFGTLCLPRWHLRSACGMNRSLTYNTILFTLSADIMVLADE